MPDWSHDLVLRALQALPDPVGSLISAFPGRAAAAISADWLDAWFQNLTRSFADGTEHATLDVSKAAVGELASLARPPVNTQLRLLSVLPVHFRGFRAPQEPINFDADLVVVEGRNSAGKSSLSEALEWLITGSLSRRDANLQGHAREYANCLVNEFRPSGEETSVTATFLADGTRVILKRVLLEDYVEKAAASPRSSLFRDSALLSSEEEVALRELWFAGVHPILMQHNLRQFITDDPAQRRQYFERLLRIDELTALIELAVLGPARLKQFLPTSGAATLSTFGALADALGKTAPGSVKQLRSGKVRCDHSTCSQALGELAHASFADVVPLPTPLAECRRLVHSAQESARAARVPGLAALKQRASRTLPRVDPSAAVSGLMQAYEANSQAVAAVATVQAEDKALARALQCLLEGGLVVESATSAQHCPVCDHPGQTLLPATLGRLLAIAPLASAAERSAARLTGQRVGLGEQLRGHKAQLSGLLVDYKKEGLPLPSVSKEVQESLQKAQESAALVRIELEVAVLALDALALQTSDPGTTDPEQLEAILARLSTAQDRAAAAADAHAADVILLDAAAGSASNDDAVYRQRKQWLELAGAIDELSSAATWEHAKGSASDWLAMMRNSLIDVRGQVIEEARRSFSEEITRIWGLLRSDTSARFHRLSIPEARGKGYKLEFEVKAMLYAKSEEAEVDALRVFSESQVNVVGIAAFLTRAQLLGHSLVVFDDPVQSMDEEHHRSFASALLPALLARNVQVVILTHNDSFARCVADHHFEREAFATLQATPSKRNGCTVAEGSRRVAERLRTAERMAEEGQLQNAWRFVRIAMERLYLLTHAKANPGTPMEGWRNLTAEDMWNKGAGAVISAHEKDAGRRLKEILSLTVAGAHDKAATSETDLLNSVQYIRSLLAPLRIGSG